MSKKADRFYFENLVKAAEWSCRAADYLEECISDYNPEKLGEMIQKMHEFEHSGDGEKHVRCPQLCPGPSLHRLTGRTCF